MKDSTPTESRQAGTCPDFAFIRKQVPIVDVARALGLRLSGQTAAHCWRTDHHQHGDRTASVAFHRTKNIARCLVCDDYPLTTIDLVQKIKNSTAFDAAKWIAARFDVPAIPKHKKLVRPERWHIGRAGVGDLLFQDLVGSGLWAAMSDAERAVFVVIRAFADEGTVKISYRALARYSGKTSDATIARVLHRFERMCILKVHRGSADGLRAVGTYELTPDSPYLQKLLRDGYERLYVLAQREMEKRRSPLV